MKYHILTHIDQAVLRHRKEQKRKRRLQMIGFVLLCMAQLITPAAILFSLPWVLILALHLIFDV